VVALLVALEDQARRHGRRADPRVDAPLTADPPLFFLVDFLLTLKRLFHTLV
jgi:hypothetical protein